MKMKSIWGDYMKTIDCLGEICPVPILKLQAVIDTIKAGEVYMIVTDHSCSCTSIRDFCKANHFHYEENEVINGVWEIVIAANK